MSVASPPLSERRREWLRRASWRLSRQMVMPVDLFAGDRVTTYKGKAVSEDWPDDATIDADLALWDIEDRESATAPKRALDVSLGAPFHRTMKGTVPLDVAADSTLEGWIRCADGRTLMEYAHGDPR